MRTPSCVISDLRVQTDFSFNSFVHVNIVYSSVCWNDNFSKLYDFTRGSVRVWPLTVKNLGTPARKRKVQKEKKFEHENKRKWHRKPQTK